MASSAGVRDKCILGPGAGRLAKGPDLSQLKPPIKTSLSGTRQIIHAMETGTGEIKKYLLNEINLMYECKTCFSVFRSLANLVAHKRTFCKAKYEEVHHMYQDKGDLDRETATLMQTVIIEAEPVECVVDQKQWNLEEYAPSYELLKTSGILQDIYSKPVVNRLLPANKNGLKHVVSKLKAKLDGTEASFYENMQRNFEEPKPTQVVHLEPLYETENALMQSWKFQEQKETVGEQYRAWQEAEDAKKHIKIGPNGQVTTSKEIIKLVTGPDGKTYSVKVPLEDFNVEENEDEEDAGHLKYPCPKCKKTYSKIMTVFKHLVNAHDLTIQEAKNKRKSITNHAIYVEDKKTKAAGDFSNPVKPMEVKVKNYTLSSKIPVNLCEELCTEDCTFCPILKASCVSDSTDTKRGDVKKAEELNHLVKEREEKENEEASTDDEVERKIMEYVNRRKVQCRICDQKFSRTLLVKNHVAGEHLRIKKWTCTLCEFGSWTKQHCIIHAERAHRLKDAASGVTEQPKEIYFDKNPLCKVLQVGERVIADKAERVMVDKEKIAVVDRDKQGAVDKDDIVMADKEEIVMVDKDEIAAKEDSYSDSSSTNSGSTSTVDQNDLEHLNGLTTAKQLAQSSNLVGGLNSTGNNDDSSEEASDGDSEISFRENAISIDSFSPSSTSVSPQSPSPIVPSAKILSDPAKRKRGPSISPKKPVKTLKRTKLNHEEPTDVDDMIDDSSNTSILSKVPESKKTQKLARSLSKSEEDVLIKDVESLSKASSSPITITTDSRGSNSSRHSDISTNSEVSSKSGSTSRSRSRSSSETRQRSGSGASRASGGSLQSKK